MAAVITNNGLTMLAAALINGSANALVSYVAVGTGTAFLNAATGTSAITSLTVLPLAANVSTGQSLTLVYQTNTATVTVAAPGALAGATTIPINSFTPSFNYPIGAGLINTPSVNDIQLQAETIREAVSAATVGAAAGETLISGYFDPTITTGTYIEVGYFGGSGASLTANSGTLVARDVIWWVHTLNADSFTNQLDSTV